MHTLTIYTLSKIHFKLVLITLLSDVKLKWSCMYLSGLLLLGIDKRSSFKLIRSAASSYGPIGRYTLLTRWVIRMRWVNRISVKNVISSFVEHYYRFAGHFSLLWLTMMRKVIVVFSSNFSQLNHFKWFSNKTHISKLSASGEFHVSFYLLTEQNWRHKLLEKPNYCTSNPKYIAINPRSMHFV